jgi:glycerol-3-phosphate dehydrogenase
LAESFDVVVVGAGVVGSAIAWRLSFEDVSVLLLEAGHDVGEGSSKANSAITASGYDTKPGTLETDLIRASNPRWESISTSLDVPFERVGSLVLAFDEEEAQRLGSLAEEAAANGVESEIVSGDRAREMAAAASVEAVAALHVPDEGIVDAPRLVTAYAELAARNRVEVRTSCRVTEFVRADDGRVEAVRLGAETIAVGAVVNAAGLGAGEISAAAGGEEFEMWPRRGQFLLIDREIGRTLTKILASIPTERTRGVLAVPTTNRTVLFGPTAEDREDRGDRATEPETLDSVFAQASRLFPSVRREQVIKSFSGLRPASQRTYRVEISELVPNLVQAAGIRSTGVSSSPALADYVCELLRDIGIVDRPRRNCRRALDRVPRLAEMTSEEIEALLAHEPGYGQIVCACEHVSAAEIHAALRGTVPVTSLDAVRKRTRASGGRCQGAYCQAGIAFLLSLQRDYPPAGVRQGGPGSTLGVAQIDG